MTGASYDTDVVHCRFAPDLAIGAARYVGRRNCTRSFARLVGDRHATDHARLPERSGRRRRAATP